MRGIIYLITKIVEGYREEIKQRWSDVRRILLQPLTELPRLQESIIKFLYLNNKVKIRM